MACGGQPSGGPQEPVEPAAGEGVVQLPLVSTSTDGQRYRLVGASFEITGPRSVTLTDTTPDTLNLPLPAGAYTIRINGNWTMERVGPPAEPVQATLVSPNPLPFTIDEGQVRAVRFQFKFPGDGQANVGITVDSGGYVTGTIAFEQVISDNTTPNPFASLAGQSVPFLISWDTATLTRESMGSDRMVSVQTGPVHVQFGGPYSQLLHDRVAPGLQGLPTSFSLRASSYGGFFFTGFRLMAFQGEPYELEIGAANFTGALDADGYPATRPFEYAPQGPGMASVALQRRTGFSSYVGVRGPATGTVSAR
jgi:hypothetical protein